MYCPNCGANHPETDRFCTVCGTNLQRPQPVIHADYIPPKKGSHWVPILILVILSVLGTALYFSTAGKNVPMLNSDTPWFSVSNGNLYFDESLYTGSSELTVPAEIGGEVVTGLGDGCFFDCETLTTVYLPDTLQSVGAWAFYGCTELRGIYVPESVTEIGSEAFYGCTGLEAVYLNNTILSIGRDTFDECNQLYYIFYSGGHRDWVDLYDEFVNPFTGVYCDDGVFFQGQPAVP